MRFRFRLTSIFLLLAATAATVYAALLGVMPGTPRVTFTNPSSLTFTATTGALTIAAMPISTVFSGGTANFAFSPLASLSLSIRLNNNGTVAGGVAGNDLVLTGKVTDPATSTVYNGTLLTGEILGFGYRDGGVTSGLTQADQFDFRFQLTGGLLSSFYASKDIGLTVTSDNGNTFVDNGSGSGFLVNFAGNAKGSLGPIPPIPPPPCTGKIGDFVWHDENRNGIQDVNEHGINGVTVTLTPPSGPTQSVVTTNSPTGQEGYYQFAGLCAGTYTVTVTTPSGGYSPTTANVGSDTSIDSSDSPVTVTLATDTSSDQTVDFGFTTPCAGALGDFVWNDLNGNGIQDVNEAGINNVTVELLDGSGNLIRSTLTTNSPIGGQPGYYKFDGLCAGDYRIHVLLPPSSDHFSPADQGNDDTKDSDVNPTTGTVAVTLGNDEVNLTIDIGLVPPPPCVGTVGDFVWNDLNGNGIQDAGEPGINGVLVTISDSTGQLYQATTTTHNGQDGYYEFTGLNCDNTYTVSATRPSTYPKFSPTGQGTPATDSDGSTSQDGTFSIAQVTLSTGHTSDITIDFGFYACNGIIGDFVWNDLNGNGIQDAGEPGIPDVIVQLQDGNGAPIVTATTDANGKYQFTGLCLGDYKVVVLSGVPASLEPTTTNAVGSTTADDSNTTPAAVTLPTDVSSDLTIDFGYKAKAAGVARRSRVGRHQREWRAGWRRARNSWRHRQFVCVRWSVHKLHDDRCKWELSLHQPDPRSVLRPVRRAGGLCLQCDWSRDLGDRQRC